MATEKNPYDRIPEEVPNVVPMAPVEETELDATFEVEDDGGVTVDFSSEASIMEPSEDIAEWYGDLCDTLEEEDLRTIASDVIENYQADKDSRGEWESMFERGFDHEAMKGENVEAPRRRRRGPPPPAPAATLPPEDAAPAKGTMAELLARRGATSKSGLQNLKNVLAGTHPGRDFNIG